MLTEVDITISLGSLFHSSITLWLKKFWRTRRLDRGFNNFKLCPLRWLQWRSEELMLVDILPISQYLEYFYQVTTKSVSSPMKVVQEFPVCHHKQCLANIVAHKGTHRLSSKSWKNSMMKLSLIDHWDSSIRITANWQWGELTVTLNMIWSLQSCEQSNGLWHPTSCSLWSMPECTDMMLSSLLIQQHSNPSPPRRPPKLYHPVYNREVI